MRQVRSCIGSERSEVRSCFLKGDLVWSEGTYGWICLAHVVVLPEAHLADFVFRRPVADLKRYIATARAGELLKAALTRTRGGPFQVRRHDPEARGLTPYPIIPGCRAVAKGVARAGTRPVTAYRGGCRVKPFRKRWSALAEADISTAERDDLATRGPVVTEAMAIFGAHPYNQSHELVGGRSYRCQVRCLVVPIGPAPQAMMVVWRGLGCWSWARSARRAW